MQPLRTVCSKCAREEGNGENELKVPQHEPPESAIVKKKGTLGWWGGEGGKVGVPESAGREKGKDENRVHVRIDVGLI